MFGKWQVFDARMDHQVEQVQDEALVVAKIEECLNALLLECLIVLMRIATHGFDHLFADTNRWLQQILPRGVLSEYEPEIDVEQVPKVVNHQIFQVTIAHRH